MNKCSTRLKIRDVGSYCRRFGHVEPPRRQAWINAAGALLGCWPWYCAFGALRGSVVNWAGFKRTESGLAGTMYQFADSISWRAIDLADVLSPYPYSYP